MSIKIGDIDVAKEIIEIHYQLFRTQKTLDLVLNANPALQQLLSSKLKEIDEQALKALQAKYPNMGIQKNS
jgi:hypothetical protein